MKLANRINKKEHLIKKTWRAIEKDNFGCHMRVKYNFFRCRTKIYSA